MAYISARQLFASQTTLFDSLGEFYLFYRGEKWDTPHFLKIQANRIIGIDICQIIFFDGQLTSGFFVCIFFTELFIGRSRWNRFVPLGDFGADERSESL